MVEIVCPDCCKIAEVRPRCKRCPACARVAVKRVHKESMARAKAAGRDPYKRRGKEYQQRWKKNNPISVLLTAAKDRARLKGLEFSLEKCDIKIPSHCPVLGILLAPGSRRDHNSAPSLDRVDNTKGYTRDNILVISWRANNLKRDATVEELEKIIKFYRKREFRA